MTPLGPFNPFTPKSDQCQISPLALWPKILHHTVWRTWLFIAFSDEWWLYYQFSLPHSYVSLEKVGRMYFLNLGVTGYDNSLVALRWRVEIFMTMLPWSGFRWASRSLSNALRSNIDRSGNGHVIYTALTEYVQRINYRHKTTSPIK